MALMATETLGIDYHQVRSIVADPSSVGYTRVTGVSRVTFATGTAIVEASKKVRRRAPRQGGDDLGCRCRGGDLGG
jgi:CO/xanthine dehydrogenase Mo-binding subunit